MFSRAAQGTTMARGPMPSEREDERLCAECAMVCPTHRAWRLHMLHRHGGRVPEWWFATTSFCPYCRRDYRSRLRGLHDLRWGAQACVEAARSGALPRATAEEVAGADACDRVARTEARRSGPHEREGPPVLCA